MGSPAYELFEELGHGEHTIVYRGYDLALGRDVAVKELNESGRKDAVRLKQFVKEASFLAQFEHENVLRIHSVDQERGWIVMELMKGTLASQVADEPMPADTVRSVMRQILGALDFLHQKNKVHGAVRASNILINEVGTVKLSDFEAADVAGELRAPTGSKKHLAPELIRTEFGTFGPTTDLYCLGFTALELLAGPNFSSFFPGTGEGAIDEDVAWLRWHSSDEALPPVKQLCPNTPDDLAEVIDQLLSKNVADRPQSAAAVLDQLSEQAFIPVVVKDAIPSISPTPVAPPPPPSRGMPAAALASQSAAGVRGGQPQSKAAAAKPSKGKLNDFLEKPYVLWPLCAAILIGAFFIGLELQGDSEEPAPMAKVRILADPGGADIMLGETKYEPDEKGLFSIEPGPYELSVKKEGFQTHSESLELKAGLNEFPISLIPIETPPPSLAKVHIRVMPESDGANILINSKQLETDSNGKVELTPGDYDLQVTKDGYEAYQQTVNVTADTDELLVSLIAIQQPKEPIKPNPIKPEPELAKIRFNIQPDDGKGARVTFDGTRRWPNDEGVFEMEPKLYQFTVERDGFEKHTDSIVASPGLTDVAIRLQERKIAYLKVNVSSPPIKSRPGELRVGDPAPPLTIREWVKGSQRNDLVSGKINVIEFWASWCGPCLRTLPHLSMLKEKYGEAINIAGITKEDRETVEEFLDTELSPGKTWRRSLNHALAIDNFGSTTKDYMTAAKRNGIPCAFIVGAEGEVEWIGHSNKLDEPLAKMFDGTWSRDTSHSATITIDSQQVTPNRDGLYELEPGDYQVEVSQEGFDTAVKTARLSRGQNELSFSLVRTVTRLDALEDEFQAAYDSKMQRPGYVAWKSKPGLPNEPEPFPEESRIKRIRSEMAALVELPPGVRPIQIPTLKGRKPYIDGKIGSNDGWNSCKVIYLKNTTVKQHDPAKLRTAVLLVASPHKLYVGVTATADTTDKGFDSVGVYLHRGVTELMQGEHIFIRKTPNGQGVGIRQTNIPFRGQSPKDDSQRWMNFPISEWLIYPQARSQSSMASGEYGDRQLKPHRHYELELDLDETGIRPGIPFSAYIQVETDPLLTNKGQFAGRQYLGKLGSEKEPKWFVITP